MSSPCRERGAARLSALLLVAVSAAALAALPGSAPGPLRVCADPDNPPFSRADESGFENRIAALIAGDLGTTVRYYWWPQRRGFLRNTLQARACDVVVGLPAGTEGVLTTPAYYHAGYVFAYRSDRLHDLRSFDDPRLRTLTVGLPLVLDGHAAIPPAHALARRGIVDNVIGYPPIGHASVGERMMAALADGTIDVAILWAPEAAWVARQQGFPVILAPAADPGAPAPARFAIAMGVRQGDAALRDELSTALTHRKPQIDAILSGYGLVPEGVRRPDSTPSPP